MSGNTQIAFKGNLIIRGKIECLTGMHVGGSKEKMEIGGVDSIVVRSPATDFPYIPGSSLKGKMRHLLEYITGAVNVPLEDHLGNVSIHPDIVRVFGIGADVKEQASNEKELNKLKGSYKGQVEALKNVGLSRLIVRDALPDEPTTEMWENLGSDLHFTEYKAENTLDRLTSAANPRFIERVVEGSKFDFEMVYTAYSFDEDFEDKINADIRNIFTGLRLLEASAIGKSGSRGYGKIVFHLNSPIWAKPEDYQKGTDNWKKSRETSNEPRLSLADISPNALKY